MKFPLSLEFSRNGLVGVKYCLCVVPSLHTFFVLTSIMDKMNDSKIEESTLSGQEIGMIGLVVRRTSRQTFQVVCKMV